MRTKLQVGVAILLVLEKSSRGITLSQELGRKAFNRITLTEKASKALAQQMRVLLEKAPAQASQKIRFNLGSLEVLSTGAWVLSGDFYRISGLTGLQDLSDILDSWGKDETKTENLPTA